MTFVKIYGTILDSSIWSEDPATRIVWITLLAMADEVGVVHASDDGIARRANVPDELCARALETLQAPDPKSKSKAHRGRRIKRIDGGWLILNYKVYRESRTPTQVKEADRKREWRKGKKDNANATGRVPSVPGTDGVSGQEEEVEVEAEKEKREAPPPVGATRRTNTTKVDVLAMGELVNRIRGLRTQPPTGDAYIPRKAVEALGDDIVRAYEAVGGSTRFLSNKGSDHSFLVREFTDALKAARHARNSPPPTPPGASPNV